MGTSPGVTFRSHVRLDIYQIQNNLKIFKSREREEGGRCTVTVGAHRHAAIRVESAEDEEEELISSQGAEDASSQKEFLETAERREARGERGKV